MTHTTYEVRVAGDVPQQDLQDLGAIRLEVQSVSTVLYGVGDASALYGLLARLRALGLEVVEVRQVPELPAPEAADQPGGAVEESVDEPDDQGTAG